MEGHQLDSESDIRSKLKKKHIRKRTCNRVLTDAITNELKRLSDLNDCSASTQYKNEKYSSKQIKDVCLNNFKDCLKVHRNVIPRKIIVYVPKAKNEVTDEYLCNMFTNEKNEIFHVDSSCMEKDNKRALMLQQYRGLRENTMSRDDQWCSCTGIDITRLFIFAKLMYETSQQLGRLTAKAENKNTQQCNIFTISVELANLRQLLNPMPGYDGVIKLDQSYPRHEDDNEYCYKPFPKFNTQEKSIRFKISIEKHCMRFNIATCKLNIFSRDFLQALETFFSVSKSATSYDTNCNVPSLSMRNWHFHNIIQGYLLGILLRNINVNTLNMMRKLYFVIITCSASNLMIEITVKLKSGIFMVYDNRFYQEVINWNKSHQLFINKSVSMATLENAIQKRYLHMHNKGRQLNLVTYTKTQRQSNPNICRANDYIIKSDIDENSSVDNYYSDSESLHAKTSEMSAIILPQKNGATLILKPDEKAGDNNVSTQSRKKDSIINNIFLDNNNIYNANFLHSKQWLAKVFSNNTTKENDKPSNIADILKFNALKETIFDRVSIQRHLESVTDLYWKQVTSQSFYMVFLKSLGQSIANIFFSAVI
ncbi:uncharacterized protein LOC114356649 [Ostrinia furnacalis]|uniref:uncharacterized protein LOC114356649 n=1 Tax=Ostrinia furnacalis TaxID=93504 RepID=UPI00103FDC99|nr:uncharacterized protein LOC114356649 [Ostrinia furnacalis]